MLTTQMPAAPSREAAAQTMAWHGGIRGPPAAPPSTPSAMPMPMPMGSEGPTRGWPGAQPPMAAGQRGVSEELSQDGALEDSG